MSPKDWHTPHLSRFRCFWPLEWMRQCLTVNTKAKKGDHTVVRDAHLKNQDIDRLRPVINWPALFVFCATYWVVSKSTWRIEPPQTYRTCTPKFRFVAIQQKKFHRNNKRFLLRLRGAVKLTNEKPYEYCAVLPLQLHDMNAWHKSSKHVQDEILCLDLKAQRFPAIRSLI